MSEPGTPTRPGPGNVLFDLWLAARAATARIDEATRAAGLDADEFAVYSVLAATGGMTPSELARWMAAPATTVSSYATRFTRRGHLERVANPRDGRSHLLRLTDRGRAAHRAAGELFEPVLEEVEGHLGPLAPAVRRHLDALREALT